jgi:dTDP-4-dehydrorhamnose 3,5-epimerase
MNYLSEVSKIKMKTNSDLSVEPTPLEGCYLIHFPENNDERGSFYRKYCQDAFDSSGLNSKWIQTNYSSNKRAGTLRGFHLQKAPFEEIKLVTCVSGRVFDAILDLRPNSKTFLKTFSTVLDLDSNKSIYIAKGVAHAYLTLEDNTSVTYQVSEKYSKEYTSGVKYSDPKVKVEWPIIPRIVSKNDLCWEPL